MIYLYVLVAIATADHPAVQTIQYFDTMAACQTYRNQIESLTDRSYSTLACVPIKGISDPPEQ